MSMIAMAKPDQKIHRGVSFRGVSFRGVSFMEPAMLDMLATRSPIGKEKLGPPRASCK